MDGNLILQQAFQTKADKHCIPAFNTIMARLAAQKLSVDLNIRDNEASADFKQVITESWKTKFQLVPPDMHWRNKAKQIIRHFKNHFLSILAGINARGSTRKISFFQIVPGLILSSLIHPNSSQYDLCKCKVLLNKIDPLLSHRAHEVAVFFHWQHHWYY